MGERSLTLLRFVQLGDNNNVCMLMHFAGYTVREMKRFVVLDKKMGGDTSRGYRGVEN